jgi:diacylglycerol kinase
MNRPGFSSEVKEINARKRGPVGLVQTHRVKRAESRHVIPAEWQRKTGRAATLVESFYHAFHGIYIGLKEERNLRIHFCAAAIATTMGVCLKLDMVSWLCLCLAMGGVIICEFLNTSLEHLVDLSARGQYHRSARYAKDTAAAAVLCASIVAALVGLTIFVPRLLTLVQH